MMISMRKVERDDKSDFIGGIIEFVVNARDDNEKKIKKI